MGQLCAPVDSEDSDKRIQELESLLKNQEAEKDKVKRGLQKERERQRKYKSKIRESDDERVIYDKIEQITNEKRDLLKSVNKEKKTITKLEDTIVDYRKQIKEMENKVEALKYKKQNAQTRAERTKEQRSRPTIVVEQATTKAKQPDKRESGLFGMGPILRDIKIPKVNLPGIGGYSPHEPPFKVKPKSRDPLGADSATDDAVSDAVGTSSSDDDNDNTYDSDSKVSTATTIILDSGYDAASEATHVYSWLHGQKITSKKDIKQLKHRLASLLTSRSEGYRQTLIQKYRENYGKNMERDIKKVIQKGHALEIIHGLLMTRAQYDAILISECVANWDIEPVADIICCRTMHQLKELDEAYKRKCKLAVRKQLQALAQKDKKKTLVRVLGSILDLKRKENLDVDMNEVNSDLNFVLTQKSFKHQNKEKLVLIFTANSVQYIKVLNAQFLLKSKDSLTTFIDKKLGPKSTAGYFCKTRIEYALDTPDYYAIQIKNLGKNFKKHQKKISDIFIQRMEIDLDIIQRVWKMKKYGDGKDLKEWVLAKTSGSKSGFFLSKMLDNCGRYAQFHDQTKPRNKILDIAGGY